MHWSQLVREGMRSTNACDPPNESFFLFNKRSVAVFEPPARSMSTGYGEQIINPSSLMWMIQRPTGNFRAGVGVRWMLSGREPMFETLIQEAAALASLALFIAMIAIWTQVLGNL
jgi:hypothetical protein